MSSSENSVLGAWCIWVVEALRQQATCVLIPLLAFRVSDGTVCYHVGEDDTWKVCGDCSYAESYQLVGSNNSSPQIMTQVTFYMVLSPINRDQRAFFCIHSVPVLGTAQQDTALPCLRILSST